MEYRQYKDTGIKTSLLGMGCMRLPSAGPGFGIDFEKSQEIIDYAYQHGVNYFDSAYVYNNGESEKVMGKVLSKYPRDTYMLATKLPNMRCSSRDEVLSIFNEQLERLGTDYIDFYLCHNLSKNSYAAFTEPHVVSTLLELKAEGKIRHLGFSSHADLETLEKFLGHNAWDFAQMQLNYLDWDGNQNARRQYEILTEHNVPVMVMEPVRGGRLASINEEADKMMKEYAPERSIASWAIRFAASLPNVQVVLSGMTTMDHVIDNVATMSPFVPVNEQEKKILEKAVEMLLSQVQVPCTQCRYCVDDCPAELNIPELIAIFNEYSISKHFMSLMALRELPEEKQPDKCQVCRECVNRCPQEIEIPDVLEKLAEATRPPAGGRR